MSVNNREAPNMKEMGPKKYKERIHKDSKYSDAHKNLPFTFSKPKKSKPNNVCIECSGCTKPLFVNESAVLVVCGSCKAVTRIKDRVRKE